MRVGKANADVTVAVNDPPETPDWIDNIITTGTETPGTRNHQDIPPLQARTSNAGGYP